MVLIIPDILGRMPHLPRHVQSPWKIYQLSDWDTLFAGGRGLF